MKKNLNLFYARNNISLIYILALADIFKNKKRILIINTNVDGCERFFLQKLKKYLNKNFLKVYYIKFKKKKYIYGKNIINTFIRSENIKFISQTKIIQKISSYKITDAYVGGDDFEVALINNLKHKTNFHFVEHGWGNPLNFHKKISYKTRLIYTLLKILKRLRIINFYPIRYNTYFGFLSKALLKNKLYINGYETKISNSVNLKKIYKKLVELLDMNQTIQTKKNINFITLSQLPKKITNIELQKILKLIIKNLDKKKDLLVFKNHPRQRENKSINNFIIKNLRKNNFEIIFLKKYKHFPIEFFLFNPQVKRIFGTLSGYILTISQILKKIKIWVPLSIFYKYPDNKYGPAANKKFEKIFRQKFTNINFF